MLVASSFLDGVAVGTFGLEDLVPGLGIAGRRLLERRHPTERASEVSDRSS